MLATISLITILNTVSLAIDWVAPFYLTAILFPTGVLLDFMEVTQVDPHWLSTGEGERFIEGNRGSGSDWVRRTDVRIW